MLYPMFRPRRTRAGLGVTGFGSRISHTFAAAINVGAARRISRVIDYSIPRWLPAAKVLAGLLAKLRSASAHGRRGNLALARTMTEKGRATESESEARHSIGSVSDVPAARC